MFRLLPVFLCACPGRGGGLGYFEQISSSWTLKNFPQEDGYRAFPHRPCSSSYWLRSLWIYGPALISLFSSYIRPQQNILEMFSCSSCLIWAKKVSVHLCSHPFPRHKHWDDWFATAHFMRNFVTTSMPWLASIKCTILAHILWSKHQYQAIRYHRY